MQTLSGDVWTSLAWFGLGLVALGGGYLAWRLRLLSVSGAIAATLFGVCLWVLGGPGWFLLAMAFFVPTSLLSKWGRHQKRAAESRVEKGSQRDAGQVLANGGVAWGVLVAGVVWPAPEWVWAFMGAFAAATADTWATEIGGLARSTPRSIVTGKPVPPGTSGGVTLVGTSASLLGATWIGGAAWLFGLTPAVGMLGALLAGTLGSVADSLLGATCQVLYRDAQGVLTERAAEAYERVRGWRWVTNDVVNLAATAVGALLGAVCYRMLS